MPIPGIPEVIVAICAGCRHNGEGCYLHDQTNFRLDRTRNIGNLFYCRRYTTPSAYPVSCDKCVKG
jgi:hypothetical protein